MVHIAEKVMNDTNNRNVEHVQKGKCGSRWPWLVGSTAWKRRHGAETLAIPCFGQYLLRQTCKDKSNHDRSLTAYGLDGG